MEIKIEKPEDLQKVYETMKADLETKGAENVKNFDEKVAAIEASLKEVKEAKPEVTAEQLKTVNEKLETTIKALDIVQIRMKNSGGTQQKAQAKTFNEILGETIERNADQIKGFKRGGQELKFDMLPDFQEKSKDGLREVKAVGDMSAAVNFPTSGEFTTDRRDSIIPLPYNRVWLADILPQGTSSGSSIIYPKENGGEGGSALWTDPTQDKAQMDFDLTSQNAYFKWIAGWVVIEREMLDDIPFLLSYLRGKMLISLKIAENDFVLNGSSDTNPVTGMLAAATAYDGSYTALQDKIIDSGWGQIVEDTFDFYNPTHTIITPRDAVAIGLNKASGSGEYDLPLGSVAFAAGGLTIAGLTTVKTTQLSAGEFITFDQRALMFIRRMQPELRMFEDAVLAKKNKVMFRVEERATLVIFNNAAIVSNAAES